MPDGKAKPPQTYVLSIRLPRAVVRGLATLADRDHRKTAEYVRLVLTEVVERNEFKVAR